MATRTPEQRSLDEERVEAALLGRLLPSHDRLIHAKVVGVTHNNADGSSRQDAIARIRQFDQVELVHNPKDEWDRNAIQVIALLAEPERRRKGETEVRVGAVRRVQVGHLEADLAIELAPALDRGEPWKAVVTRVMLLRTHGLSLMLYRETPAAKQPYSTVEADETFRKVRVQVEPIVQESNARALRRSLRRSLGAKGASRWRIDAAVSKASGMGIL